MRAKNEQKYQGQIRQWLSESNIDFEERAEPACFIVNCGSAVVFLILDTDSGEEDAMVILWAPLVFGAEIDAELTEFLLRENARRRFGAFAIDEQGTIVMGHTLLISALTSESLLSALGNLALGGDEIDDWIISRYGGMHAADYYNWQASKSHETAN